MPSRLHEIIVELFRQRPALALELLAPLRVALPPGLRVRPADPVFRQVQPVERRGDLVLILEDDAGPRLGLVLEVQLARADDKKRVWLLYAASLAVRLGAPAWVLVVAPDPAVAEWAADPLALGPAGSAFWPFVIGRGAVPWVRDLATARAAPELAALSAVAHAAEPGGLEVVLTALAAAAGLDAARTTLYTDYIVGALPEAVRRALEAHMAIPGYEYQSELVRKWVQKGREEGREAGREEGRVTGKAESVLAIVAARALPLTAAERARILACADLDVLDRWLARALTAASAADLLD